MAASKETYVSLLAPKGLDINIMLFVVYGKYGNDWKINILKVGEYSYMGKTAPDYYSDALKQNNQNHIANATLLMVLASQIVNPAGSYVTYKNDSQMKMLYFETSEEFKETYHFPIFVNNLKTKPQILSIELQYMNDKGVKGIYPIVKYMSSIKLSDTVALKVENIELRKQIGKIFKGVDKNQGYLIYQAFNNAHNGNEFTYHYVFLQKLN